MRCINDFGNSRVAGYIAWVCCFVFIATCSHAQSLPVGTVTMQNGAPATVSSFKDGMANVRYINPETGKPANYNTPIKMNYKKLARVIASNVTLAAKVGYFFVYPVNIGEDCGLDAWCAARAITRQCVSSSGTSTQGKYSIFINFPCQYYQRDHTSKVGFWPDGMPIGFEDPFSKAMYDISCSDTSGSSYCPIENKPDCPSPSKGKTCYLSYSTRCPVGDYSCVDTRVGERITDAEKPAIDAAYGPDKYSGDETTGPVGPLVVKPGDKRPDQTTVPPDTVPLVPDVWDPVTVPGVEPTTSPDITSPGFPPTFNPTTNPVLPNVLPDPLKPLYPAPGDDPTTDPTTDPGTSPSTTTVNVKFPDKMDVNVLNEELNVNVTNKFAGDDVTGAGPLGTKTIDVGDFDQSSWASGTCPASPTVTGMGLNLTFDLEPVCSSARMLGGIFFAIGALSGLYIALGGIK